MGAGPLSVLAFTKPRSRTVYMRRLFFSLVLGSCLTFVWADSAAAADPPGTQQILSNLKQWFTDHSDKDTKTMGKLEAAKAFGFTKPYDYVPEKKDDSKKDD